MNACAQIKDNAIGSTVVQRPKADPSKANQVGAPMPGVVIGVKVSKGDKVRLTCNETLEQLTDVLLLSSGLKILRANFVTAVAVADKLHVPQSLRFLECALCS